MHHTCAPDPWVTRPRPNAGARVRLFCFPYAGGGASMYRTWAAHLPADIELLAVQPPGREERLRERPCCEAGDLVARAAAALDPYLDRPFAFFGHSMGALVAFELARALAGTNRHAMHLFVSARCGPRLRHRLPPMASLGDADLVRQLRRLGNTPEALLADPELLRVLLPMLRADLTLCEAYAYAPGKLLRCPITAFGGAFDEFVRRDDVLAWRAETESSFRAHMFPGGHFFLQDARARLLQVIAEALAPSADVPLSA
jgi:medium-chain acyl-[acyl-carrier-protein] hydrolase